MISMTIKGEREGEKCWWMRRQKKMQEKTKAQSESGVLTVQANRW